jgi:hypothetical protein
LAKKSTASERFVAAGLLVLGSAVLLTPAFGWTPVLVAAAAIMAATYVAVNLPEQKPRR